MEGFTPCRTNSRMAVKMSTGAFEALGFDSKLELFTYLLHVCPEGPNVK